jgi:RNA polymerase sigma factor (sigma-70 family)
MFLPLNIHKSAMNINQWMSEFVSTTQTKLLSMLTNMLPRGEAEEVLQEAYLKVFVELSKGTPFEPLPFVFRVARNVAISRLRHQKIVSQHECRLQQVMPWENEANPMEDALKVHDQDQLLIDAINSLPPICRQVFLLRKREEKSHSEIAQLLNISVKTVENHLSKGMRLCRLYITAQRMEREQRISGKTGTA